jgi:DNA polymerase-1
MAYSAISTIEELKNYLSGTALEVFDFETAPNEKNQKEEKAALDAHKSHIAEISLSIAEGSGVYLPLIHHT